MDYFLAAKPLPEGGLDWLLLAAWLDVYRRLSLKSIYQQQTEAAKTGFWRFKIVRRVFSQRWSKRVMALLTERIDQEFTQFIVESPAGQQVLAEEEQRFLHGEPSQEPKGFFCNENPFNYQEE